MGYHASGRSAALFEANYGKPSTVALNRASADLLRHDSGGVLSPRGVMLIGGPDEDAAFDTDSATFEMDEISMDAATSMIPILNRATVKRAAFQPTAEDIDTHQLMLNFQRKLTAAGGTIHTDCHATAITRAANGWEVQTSTQGTLTTKTLVNAAGAWVDHIAQMAGITPIGATPLRRSMGRIPAPGGHDVSGWPMLFSPGEVWYAKPDAGALIVSPADEDPVPAMDAYADDMVLAEGVARYEHHVTEPVTRMLATWAGLRTFSPDRQLVLGPDPADPTFVWSACQGGYGFSTAAAASQLVADCVAGHPPEIGNDIAAALSPARFR